MNESQKNIETCLAEDILAEVAGVPQDAHFRSLVDEALDPLKQQAATQAGWDDYKEVVLSHKPYTFTSSVRQMKSNLILLLRRLWRFPFGRGAIRSLSDAGSLRSLADMWSHYITRLQGNATYGIPSRLAQLTDLPSAPLLLSGRKISGVPDAPDGISLVQLLMAKYGTVTELTDDNKGWIYNRDSYVTTLLSIFPNLKRLTLGCSKATVRLSSGGLNTIEYLCFANMDEFTYPLFYSGQSSQDYQNLTDVEFPSLIKGSPLAFITTSGWWVGEIVGPTRLYMPHLKEINRGTNTFSNSNAFFAVKFSSLEVLELPELERVNIPFYGGSCLSSLRELRMPKLVYCPTFTSTTYPSTSGLPNLILLEVGAIAHNFDLQYWNPTNVLADQDLLQQFLSNFRDYIADRLTDNGAGKTLTLSQAVFSAVIEGTDPICDDIKGIIEDKGWKVQDTNNNIFPTT